MTDDAVRNFRLASFTFSIKFAEPAPLVGYLGSTLRGGLGKSLRKVACISTSQECDQCDGRFQCPYFYIFETPPNPDAKMMRKYPRAPHPFVIEAPFLHQRQRTQLEVINFGITVIGKAIDLVASLIAAIRHLGLTTGLGSKKNLFVIESVTNNGKEIYSPKDCVINDDFRPVSWAEILKPPLPSNRLRLRIETPLRLKFDGKLVSDLEFHILIRNLLRRISALSYFHCGADLSIDFRDLIEKATLVSKVDDKTCWVDWKRYSSRQQATMQLGGLLGEIEFEGEFTPFMPYLALGEKIHAGKNTSFGLGKYSIEAVK